MPFVLTELFNQDVLEEYFGRHRSTERKHGNPDLYNFDYNSNTIHMQQLIAPVTGKRRGGHKQKRCVSWVSTDNALRPIRHQNK